MGSYKTVQQYFLIGKYSISGSISHNALRCYSSNLVVVLHVKLLFTSLIAMEKTILYFSLIIYVAKRHWLKVLYNIWWNENIL